MVWNSSLKMKQIPKAEWHLLCGIQERFELTGPDEVLTVLLRTAYELMSYGVNREGYHLLLSVINQWRSDPTEARVYELPPRLDLPLAPRQVLDLSTTPPQ